MVKFSNTSVIICRLKNLFPLKSEDVMQMENTINSETFVSICIPVFNAEKTVQKTLTSIMNQSHQNFELIISDNASTDRTLTLIKSCIDSRMKIFKNEVNSGCAEYNWNKCISLAKGDYISIVHADDIYRSDMLKRQIEVLDENPKISAVFTMAYFIDQNDKIFGRSIVPKTIRDKSTLNFNEIFVALLENRNSFLLCPSVMVRSEIYKKHAPFKYELFRTSSDLDMWLRILKEGPIVILNEPLFCYRVSKDQESYKLNYFRTEPADFFNVMDYYLTQEPQMSIPKNSLEIYQKKQLCDEVLCSFNLLCQNRMNEAKKRLVGIIKKNGLITRYSFLNPRYFTCSIFCMIILMLGLLKMDKIVRRFVESNRNYYEKLVLYLI